MSTTLTNPYSLFKIAYEYKGLAAVRVLHSAIGKFHGLDNLKVSPNRNCQKLRVHEIKYFICLSRDKLNVKTLTNPYSLFTIAYQ